MSRLRPPFLRTIHLGQPTNATCFPLSLPLFRHGLSLSLTQPVTIVVGENGSGKSTFLEAIADHCGFNLTGGNRDHVHVQRNDVRPLTEKLQLSWLPKVPHGFFFRAESFTGFADYIDDLAADPQARGLDHPLAPYDMKSLHERSHSEAFHALFKSRKQGLFILDEPESALSPIRQISLLAYFRELVYAGRSQIIMATHSPILMAYPGAQLLSLEDGKLTEAPYQSTRHYQTYHRFLEHPETYLSQIFD